MKIFFPISIYYPSQVGGPANTIYWHCKALKDKNENPIIVTTDFGINDEKLIRNSFQSTESGEVIYTENKIINIHGFKEIRNNIKRTDLVHLNSLFSLFSIYTFLYIKLFSSSKKIIWSVRGELNENALKFSAHKKQLILPIYKFFNKNIYFHSTSNQETVDIKKIFTTNEVIQLPNYMEPSTRLNLHKKKQLLYLGRIHEIKAIDKLIEALSISNEFKLLNYKLIIAGKPEARHIEYLNYLKQKVLDYSLNDQVIFVGHVEGNDKEILYAESELLILPSETENFGNVVVEALNQSTPVLASKGTPWNILEVNQCGYHVNNNPQELAKTIDKYLLLNDFEKELLRKRAVQLIDNEFNVNTQIDNWINIYKNLTNANHQK